jgi:hypothetical protein
MEKTFLMFKSKNHLIFDIQHLSAKEKRKEIKKYNPFHYIFGYELKDKCWLIYGGKYEQ